MVEEREGDVENGGEVERGSTVREKTVEMATSTIPWQSSGYNFLAKTEMIGPYLIKALDSSMAWSCLK